MSRSGYQAMFKQKAPATSVEAYCGPEHWHPAQGLTSINERPQGLGQHAMGNIWGPSGGWRAEPTTFRPSARVHDWPGPLCETVPAFAPREPTAPLRHTAYAWDDDEAGAALNKRSLCGHASG